MPRARMHADEIDVDAGLVSRLVARQFPRWADLPLQPVESGGTDNALFRLGDELSVRLPLVPRATGQIEMDMRWLPGLAPVLPLTIPMLLARGEPAEGYPWEWGVYRWIEGESATTAALAEPERAAADLARFLAALWRLDPAVGPPAGGYVSRGVPLRLRHADTRSAIAELGDEVDGRAATTVWEEALAARDWDRDPVWLHGDLLPGNMLVDRGRLAAVIDFSCLCTGDPACDLMVGWTVLDAPGRAVLRAELEVDDATWARARGWALSFGLIALPYYLHTNPLMVRDARRAIEQALLDPGQ